MKTTQPRKQRKQQYNAPLHLRHKQLRSSLSTELRDKYGIRNTRVNTGDTIEVMRGDSAGEAGIVAKVDLKSKTIFAEGITAEKADGEEYMLPLIASNLRVTKLNLDDPVRESRLGGESK
jgi:large subunit ribosomal protein L24|tara:strand:+ start:779 stop:1138 length:360 start_codon:yes stop_codon:yes gene_type:complete